MIPRKKYLQMEIEYVIITKIEGEVIKDVER